MPADTTAVLSRSDRAKSLTAVILSAFGVGIPFGIGYPLVSLVFESWQQPNWVIGLAGAAPSVATLLLLPLVPSVLSRIGAVPAMAIGCLISAAGFIGLYLSHDVTTWIALRFIMSAGLTLPWLIGETWINTVTTETTRGRIVSLYAASFFLGFAVGPPILQLTGTTGPLPYLIGVFSTLISILPILLARRLAPDMINKSASGVRKAFRLVPVGMTAAFLGGVLEMSHFSLLANVAIASGVSGERSLELLTVLLVGGLTLQFFIGWLADKVSRSALAFALSLTFIVLAAALPFCLQSPEAGAVVVFLLGGIVIGFYTLGLVIVGEQVDAGDLAVANAAFIMTYQVGGIIGPGVAGLAMTFAPVEGFVATVIGFTILAMIRAARLNRRQSRQRAA